MSLLPNFGSNLRVAVIGASGGIGRAFVDHLTACDQVEKLYTFSRSETGTDFADEDSIKAAAESIEGELDVVIVASGVLHGEDFKPEKALRDLDLGAMEKVFLANTFGPALCAKYFLPLLPRDRRSVFAALSARVGSISDNQLGGWYSYRASKTALNMMLKTAAIEMGRKYKHAAVIGLHPGTVETALSNQYSGGINHEIFSPEQSTSYMLKVIDEVSAEQSGSVFAWDGQKIPS